jgi:hypothetical protein
MRRKYFGWEQVFEFIWQHCDRDGLWTGDAASLRGKFGVTEDEAREVLGELCDRRFIERVGTATYIIARWRERDEASDMEEELEW